MKTNITMTLLLTTYSVINAQIGVNTTTPKATLDVTAKNNTGISSTPEGIIIPRVDREKAQSMTGVETSTLIYVNNISNGTLTGTAVNIDQEGYYYYFNGTVWVKLHRPDNIIAGTNLYNTDGILTGNRVVTQGANTLTFTSDQANGFSVDGTTFSVDAANDRIGIGTTLPTEMLDIAGPTAFNYTLTMPQQEH